MRGGVELLYPPACALCSESLAVATGGPELCSDCRAAVVDGRPACPRCGTPLPMADGTPLACASCRVRKSRLDAVVRLGRYEEMLRDAVLRTKHLHEEPLMRALGRLLAVERGEEILAQRPSCLVPIPMHWTRRVHRGVNGPEIIARTLAKELGLPLRTRWLYRARMTQKQANLSVAQRRLNLRGAFRLRWPKQLADARVLLIDDIMTTGATGNEAARTLRQYDIPWVAMAVLARAADG
jgi:ComF family protein